MMLATVHIHPALTIPAGVLCMGIILWYWIRLGDDSVPETRRRIRRASLLVMLIVIPLLVNGLSFVDDERDPSTYTIVWALSITLVLVIVFIVFLDVLNNLRIHRRQQQAESAATRARLVEAAEEARERLRESREQQRGGPDRDESP